MRINRFIGELGQFMKNLDKCIFTYLTPSSKVSLWMHRVKMVFARMIILSAVLLNSVAHVGNDAAQPVSADVCMGIDGNSWVSSVFDETVKHLLYVASLVAARV